MTIMEQQIQALNVQLVVSNVMGQAIDSLRQEPGAAINDLRRMLAEARAGNQPANKAREMTFIDKSRLKEVSSVGRLKKAIRLAATRLRTTSIPCAVARGKLSSSKSKIGRPLRTSTGSCTIAC